MRLRPFPGRGPDHSGSGVDFLVERADAIPTPRLRLQAAPRRIVLGVDDSDLALAQIDSDLWGIQLALRDGEPFHLVPPLTSAVEGVAPPMKDARYVRHWAEHFANCLVATRALAPGRFAITPAVDPAPPRSNLAPDVEAVPEEVRFAHGARGSLSSPSVEWKSLGSHGNGGVFRLRRPPLADASRVKLWRKRAREGRLPPVLLFYVSGLTMFALLDGHDRLAAAIAEGMAPPLLVLWHVRQSTRAPDPALQEAIWDVVSRRQDAWGETGPPVEEVKQDNDLLRSVSVPRDRFVAKTRASRLGDDAARWEGRLLRMLGEEGARDFLEHCS